MHAYKGALTVKEEKDDSNSKWKRAYAYLDAPYSSLCTAFPNFPSLCITLKLCKVLDLLSLALH